ncbi:hypothetical protein LXA47_31220 [Massilia sp. P8910]|uniref:hypothetical protein n=1 Tax=Massilia antarctica TaxID=2765360 RepID=UPI001E3EF985|nr:hypothetical protein [Massilia antarctica]MCE3608042.1 hypothetical protein [Massilia antarctica]
MTQYCDYLLQQAALSNGVKAREVIGEQSLETFMFNGWRPDINRIPLDGPVWVKWESAKKGLLMIHEGFGNFVPVCVTARHKKAKRFMAKLYIRDVILWKRYDPDEPCRH